MLNTHNLREEKLILAYIFSPWLTGWKAEIAWWKKSAHEWWSEWEGRNYGGTSVLAGDILSDLSLLTRHPTPTPLASNSTTATEYPSA